MYAPRTRHLWGWLAVLGFAAAQAAYGGIPEPGVILYGQVYDANGVVLHEGTLSWTITPQDGKPPVSLSTELTSIQGLGGPYSYRVIIPLETEVSGFPVSSKAISVQSAPVTFTRRGEVVGTSIQMTHPVTFSRADRGTAKRVDVCISCAEETVVTHSADTDENFKFSLREFLRVFEFYNATPGHAYHADGSTPDGYNVGPGQIAGAPHSADYAGGPDWQISMAELLRMVDLFTSTGDHSYSPDPLGEDGFKKGAPGQKIESEKSTGFTGLTVTRRSVQGGFENGLPYLDIALDVDAANPAAISALGISDSLPTGWTYAGLVSAPRLLSEPRPGAAGEIDFAWFNTPAMPFTLAYRVEPGDLGAAAKQAGALQGAGIYREVTGRLGKSVAIGGASNGDLDGDGIPDAQEGYGDYDNDLLPNYLDGDTDNDGVPDSVEAGYDGDPAYNPYDAASNPNGTDLNAASSDTDGDGYDDNTEIAFHGDPLNPEKTPALPASKPWTVLLTAIVLGLAAWRATHSRRWAR